MQNLTLHSILSPSVFTVAPDTPLPEVLASMESLRISCVVAIDGKQHPLGIFTEQDAIRLMAERKIAAQLRMSDAMNSPVLTAPVDMDFRDAYRLISDKGYRHLVAVDQTGRLAGVISEADFLHHMGMEYLVELKTVGSAMTSEIVSLKEDATLADAVDLMSKHKISCIIVTRDQKPVGILTERDSVGLARTINDPTRINIVRVMKSPVRTIDAALPIQAAMKQMESANIRRLVVVEGEILTGIVTRHDIVKIMQGHYLEFLHETLERQRKDLQQAHKQIEQTRQQLLYQGLMGQVTDTIIVFKAENGCIVDCNVQACRDLGYTRDELLRLTFFDFSTRIKPGTDWQAELDKYTLEGQRLFETRYRRRDGSLFPVEINARLISKDKERYIVAVARDLSESKRAAAQLLLQDTALNSIANAVVITDMGGVIQWTNPAFSELTGYTADEAFGKHQRGLTRSGVQSREFYKTLWDTILSGEVWRGEIINKHKDGTLYTEEMTITPVCDENKAITHFIAVKQNITSRKLAELQLREAAVVMQSTHEGVVITDTTPRIIAINHAYTTITGYFADEVLGKNPGILSSGQHEKSFFEAMWHELLKNGHWQGELWCRRKNGEIFPQWLSISAIRNEQQQTVRYIGVFSDISKLKESQSQLEFLAHHDPLTELFNRSSVEARMQQELERAQRNGQQLAVLFIDLDRFKQVNDSFGHLVGDELLCSVAVRLMKHLRDGDTLGRLGGDEFVLLSAPLQERKDAAVIARNILKALAEPFCLSNGAEVFIGGSIGISLFPDDGASVAEMTRNADAAMYLAKESGRNQFSFYTPELNADARNKLEMENDLRRAVLNHELRLHYQPKLDLRTGKTCGAEALTRWQKPDGHWVPPSQFIPLAEKSGLILNIGEWVLEQACAQIRHWLNDGLLDVCIAVNIPARQFHSENLDKQVRTVLEKYKIPPHLLELELTESLLMQEPELAIETMNKLKKTGVKLSLDDFGTGYSNFAYLRRFPIDCLKIDQSFVRGVATKAEDAMIVDAMIGLAQRMHLRVIAEGVETAAQLAYLRAHHCDELQGHYFSKALTASEFAKLLRSTKKMAV